MKLKSAVLSLVMLAVFAVGQTITADVRSNTLSGPSMMIPNAFESQVIELRAGEEATFTLPRIPTAYVVWVDAEDLLKQGLIDKVKTTHRMEALDIELTIKLSADIPSGESFKITIYQLDPLSQTIQILMTNELIIQVQ